MKADADDIAADAIGTARVRRVAEARRLGAACQGCHTTSFRNFPLLVALALVAVVVRAAAGIDSDRGRSAG